MVILMQATPLYRLVPVALLQTLVFVFPSSAAVIALWHGPCVKENVKNVRKIQLNKALENASTETPETKEKKPNRTRESRHATPPARVARPPREEQNKQSTTSQAQHKTETSVFALSNCRNSHKLLLSSDCVTQALYGSSTWIPSRCR